MLAVIVNPSPTEIIAFTVEAEYTAPAPDCTEDWSYEIKIDGVPTTGYNCNLSSGKQLARLCVTLKNRVFKEYGSTCYSAQQRASGSVDANGNIVLDFLWAPEGFGLVDGAGDRGQLVTGKLTGQFNKNNNCRLEGTVNGEFHAWTAPNVNSFCDYTGYDIRQKFTGSGYAP